MFYKSFDPGFRICNENLKIQKNYIQTIITGFDYFSFAQEPNRFLSKAEELSLRKCIEDVHGIIQNLKGMLQFFYYKLHFIFGIRQSQQA